MWFIHNIYQYFTTFINIVLMICLHNIQNNHNIYLSQQVVNVINILDYKSIQLFEVLSYKFYALFDLFL